MNVDIVDESLRFHPQRFCMVLQEFELESGNMCLKMSEEFVC